MQVGRYRVSVHNHGFFRLDGGAMFGSVPKNLWAGLAPPDEQNRILLATRSLVVEDGDRKMVVDLGCGDKWSDKLRSIYAIDGHGGRLNGVTDVLLTHLHFDHAGGVSRLVGASVEPSYPDAVHYVSKSNIENARHPHLRERASYLPEDVVVLDRVELRTTSDGEEVWAGVTVHQSNGHTRGLQWVRVSGGGVTVAYPADLIPTSKHLPLPFVMGYDMCAETQVAEKESFLKQAIEEGWIVVFEHDPEVAAARLGLDDRGRPTVIERYWHSVAE